MYIYNLLHLCDVTYLKLRSTQSTPLICAKCLVVLAGYWTGIATMLCLAVGIAPAGVALLLQVPFRATQLPLQGEKKRSASSWGVCPLPGSIKTWGFISGPWVFPGGFLLGYLQIIHSHDDWSPGTRGDDWGSPRADRRPRKWGGMGSCHSKERSSLVRHGMCQKS